MLSKQEGASPRDVSEEKIVDALRYGQALSALNCAFEGARGAMYGLDKTRFTAEVEAILNREEGRASVIDCLRPEARRTVKCICPACQKSAKRGRKQRT